MKPTTAIARYGAAVALCLIAVEPAYAYVDPGTGSLLLQGLLAALVSVVFFWNQLVLRIKRLFGIAPKSTTDSSDK